MSDTVVVPNGSDMGFGGMGGLGGILIGALLGNGSLFGGRGYGGYGSPAAGAVASEVVLTPTLNAIQNQISSLSNELDANAILAGITSVNQNVSGTSRDIGRDIANLSTAQAQGNFTTLTSINGLGASITAQANQNALQQLNSFNQLATTTLQGFNSQAMQVQNSTNQIIAQGTANAAAVAAGFCDISRQLSECCCEMKQVVKDDGNATRALINDLNVQSLRDQLSAANGKISNNEQNQYLLNTILQHIKPTPVVVS